MAGRGKHWEEQTYSLTNDEYHPIDYPYAM